MVYLPKAAVYLQYEQALTYKLRTVTHLLPIAGTRGRS